MYTSLTHTSRTSISSGSASFVYEQSLTRAEPRADPKLRASFFFLAVLCIRNIADNQLNNSLYISKNCFLKRFRGTSHALWEPRQTDKLGCQLFMSGCSEEY